MRGIICLSTLEWDYIWNRQHELMSRFAAEGRYIVFVEPLGIREPTSHDWPRIVGRLRRATRSVPRGRQAPPTLQIVAPLTLPLHARAWARWINRLFLRGLVIRAQQWTGPAPLLWTYYATEAVLDIHALLPDSPVVFDCTDEIALNHKGVARSYRRTEQALLASADAVIVSSQALLEAKRPLSRRIRLISHGANIERFQGHPEAEPTELAVLPHPRLLFFGGLDERLDEELLAGLAESRPDWHIVLIGPRKVALDRVLDRTNVTWLGPKAHETLPAYLAASDVLLIPYRLDAYARFIYPTKIHECLASGRPTVAVPLPDLQSLAPVVLLAEGISEWERAIELALSPAATAPSLVAARRAVAAQHSWDRRFEEIREFVDPLLLSPLSISPSPIRA
ncbi:MAG TPA: hypothetical protein DEP84_29230 [Chloroflexi bacterium]|nr:hypothetical protein [Chloroflexota bacterium]